MIRLSIGLLAMGCMTGTVCANERSESLVKVFQAFCTLPLQSFEELDAKTSAQKLRVQTDYKPLEEDSNSERVRTKSWLMEAGNGAYRLVAIRRTAVDGAQRDMCGIAVSEMIGDDVKANLMKSLQLGSPLRQIRGGGLHGTGTISVWKTTVGSEEMDVLLAESNMSGTSVHIARNLESGR